MFDSFAAGVPIIQNTGGWIRDLVEEQACGLNARMGDPHSMAECIRRMSTDDTLRMRLGRNAKRLAETAFNRDILSREYREGLLSLTREAEADNRMDASARGGRSTGTVTQTSDRA
jgi:glycosyltransferase involved in cell wall biosynthesis